MSAGGDARGSDAFGAFAAPSSFSANGSNYGGFAEPRGEGNVFGSFVANDSEIRSGALRTFGEPPAGPPVEGVSAEPVALSNKTPEAYYRLYREIAGVIPESQPIPSKVIFGVFTKSGLPKETLNTIWVLATSSTSKKMTKESFFKALGLIALAQRGEEVSLEHLLTHSTKPFPNFERHPCATVEATPATRAEDWDFWEGLRLSLIDQERYPEALECELQASSLKSLAKLRSDLKSAKLNGDMDQIVKANSEIRRLDSMLAAANKIAEWEDKSSRREETIAEMGLRVLQRKNSESEKEFCQKFSASRIRSIALKDLKAASRAHRDAINWANASTTTLECVEEDPTSTGLPLEAWESMLKACCAHFRQANDLTVGMVKNRGVAKAVVASDRGKSYLTAMIEIYRVSRLIQAGCPCLPGVSFELQAYFAEMSVLWTEFSKRLDAADLSPRDVSFQPASATTELKDICSLTLCQLDVEGLDIVSSSFTAPNGRRYFAACARFWKNTMKSTLPSFESRRSEWESRLFQLNSD